MDYTSTIRLVDTGSIYAVFKLSFSNQCKIWCFNPLRYGLMVNNMKTTLHSEVLLQRPQLTTWSKPNVDTFFQVKLTRNCSSWLTNIYCRAVVHNLRPYGRMWPSIKIDAVVHMSM